MTSPRIDIATRDGVAIATLDGEIDIANAAAVADALLHAAADQPVGLIADLTRLRYLDSGGVRMLFKVADQLVVSRRRFALVVPECSPLNRLIKITSLDEAAWVGTAVDTCREAMVSDVRDGAC
jgi:anti-sigma B factor antagonist